MKTSKLKFVLTALLVAVMMGQTAFASTNHNDDPNPIKVKATESFVYKVYAFKNALKFKLAFKNVSEDKVIIRILDQKGRALYKEVLKNREIFNRNYDMSRLGAGVYKVEIGAGDLKAEQEIALGVSDRYISGLRVSNYSR